MVDWGFSFTAYLGPISWTLILSYLDLLPYFATEHSLVVFLTQDEWNISV